MKFRYLLLLFALFLSACCSSRTAKEQENSSLLNYNIRLTTGGGFTGARTGYTIDSAGTVKSFEASLTGEPKSISRGRLSAAQIKELNELFPSVLAVKLAETGNMTTTMLLKNDTSEVKFSWKNNEPDPSAPAQLIALYNKVKDFINNTKE